MLSESEKEPGAVDKRKGRDPDEAQSAAEAKRARAGAAARVKDNRLLAGFLAHEFLSAGTLLGRRWDPSSSAVEQSKPPPPASVDTYTQVSYLLLKAKGPHIPGVMNPTQLAGWLRM